MMRDQMTDMPHPYHRNWWHIAVWFIVCVFTLLLLTLAGASWWLWGWKCNDELSFHESWSPAERAALTEFNTYLHTQLANDPELVMNGTVEITERLNNNMPTGEIPPPPSGLAARIASAVMIRLHVAPIATALQEISASGKGDPQEPVNTPAAANTTPAILAAQTAHIPALKALISHGANPNAISVLEHHGKVTELESPITPLISGSFINGRRISRTECREALDFMISHGADLNASQNIVGTSLQLALHVSDDTEILLWAIGHGYHPSIAEFKFLLGSGNPSHVELVEHILHKKLVNVNDTSDGETPLQLLSMRMAMADVEDLEQGSYEKALDLLLSAGADPNLTTPDTHRTALKILESRTNFERADGMPENSCCLEGPDIRTRWQMICDKVRRAGVKYLLTSSSDEESAAPEEDCSDDELESEYDDGSEEWENEDGGNTDDDDAEEET